MQGIKLSVGDITTSVPNAKESRYEDQSIKRVLRHKQVLRGFCGSIFHFL
jgi:hypothetical protein